MKWIATFSALVLVFLLCFFTPAHGFKCYICNSFNDSTCASDSLNKDLLQECSDQKGGVSANMCRKIRQWVDFDLLDMKANERIVRMCGYETTERECYYRAGFGGRQEVCTCRTEGCNNAFTAVTNWPMLVVLVLASLVGVRHAV